MSNLSAKPDDGGEIIRWLIPAGTVLIATLLMTLPLPLAWGVMPHFPLLFVLIWASIQPRLMPAWVAFLLGFATDALFGGPIGIWALLFAAAAVGVRLAEARVEGHSLAVDWTFAAVLVAIAHLLCWRLLHFTGNAAPFWPLMAQALVTMLAYPLVASLAARIQRRLVDQGG